MGPLEFWPAHLPMNEDLKKRLELPFDREAWEQRKCDDYNRTPGTLDEYDCPQCMNRGFHHVRREGRTVAVPCACTPIRQSVRACRASGMDMLLKQCTFDSFLVREPWMADMKNTALGWAREGTDWLLLSGQSGCGKTHLAVAACGYRIFRRGQRAEFLPWREAMDDYRNMDPTGKRTRLKRWMEAKLLYVDDLLKAGQGRRVPDWELEEAFAILNHRYNNGLDTVISTELLPTALMGLDEALGGRILERAGKHTAVAGPDRKRNHRTEFLLKAPGPMAPSLRK